MIGSYKIPYFAIDRQYKSIKDEILNAYDEVLSSGKVMSDDKTAKLEETIAKMCNRKYAIAVNSGSTALTFSMIALGINPTSNVICTAESYVATINSIFSTGAKPNLCDTDLMGLIDIKKFSKKMIENASALLYVNLYGNCVDYDKMQNVIRFFYSSQVPIIEDAAQSFGSYFKGKPSGSLGDVSCLSFDPTKALNNYGNAGMVLTDNYDDMIDVRQYRSNGIENDYGGWSKYGMNVRISEMDAACLLVKLAHHPKWQKRRTEIAEYYNKELSGLDNVEIPYLNPDVISNWSKYVIRVNYDRIGFNSQLNHKGIQTKIHYKNTLYQHATLTSQGYQSDAYKDTTAFKNSISKLSIPIYPELTDTEVEYIVEQIKILDKKEAR